MAGRLLRRGLHSTHRPERPRLAAACGPMSTTSSSLPPRAKGSTPRWRRRRTASKSELGRSPCFCAMRRAMRNWRPVRPSARMAASSCSAVGMPALGSCGRAGCRRPWARRSSVRCPWRRLLRPEACRTRPTPGRARWKTRLRWRGFRHLHGLPGQALRRRPVRLRRRPRARGPARPCQARSSPAHRPSCGCGTS
jgi:hypothetical protein